MKNLALFDFDGTLTTKDTFIAFIKFYCGTGRFLLGFLLLSPILVLFKLKIIPNWKAKEYVLTYFFKGEHIDTFNSMGKQFVEKGLPKMMRKEAELKFKKHIDAGDMVVVVSASAVNWVKPWTDKMGVDIIATNLQTENNLLTGKIIGRNCYGPEKVARIGKHLNVDDYTDIHVYGDSRGDREMLDLATYAFFRKF